MKDHIYIVDPQTQTTVSVAPTTFSDLKVKERKDLQEWLKKCPEVLGEPLLLITSEYDKFVKADRRLDLLLLDNKGTIVVAELKLDASGTLADQQAIRYAAFCSTMTMDDVVKEYAETIRKSTDYVETIGKSHELAREKICEFLECGELPELNDRPRIMLVAGAFNDQELTATVLWLRKFGVDISCVELTPYRCPGDEAKILLVPKTLIPLTEAEEYQIKVEQKAQTENARNSRNRYSDFFRLVLKEYAKLNPSGPGPSNPSNNYMKINIGQPQVHYEWLVRLTDKYVGVALHFEAGDQQMNLQRLQHVMTACPKVAEGIKFEMKEGAWGDHWAHLCFCIPYTGDMPDLDVARKAAELMEKLVARTLDAIKNLKKVPPDASA